MKSPFLLIASTLFFSSFFATNLSAKTPLPDTNLTSAQANALYGNLDEKCAQAAIEKL